MKKAKKVLALLTALVMILAFTSCGKKEEPAPEPADVNVQLGIVLDYNLEDGLLDIDTMDGEMVFAGDSVKTAEVIEGQDGDGIHKNDYVRVQYTGELNGTDTSNCTVTQIIVQAAEEHEITGKLVDIDISGCDITIKAEDGRTLEFDATNAVRLYKNGIKKGNEIEVVYTGEIVGEDTSACDVRSIIDEACNKEFETDKITIKAKHDTVYATACVNVRAGTSTSTKSLGKIHKGEKIERTGISSNGWSRVKYNGKDAYILNKYLTTKKPEPKPEPTTKKPTKPTTEPTSEEPTVEPTTDTPTSEEPTSEEPTVEPTTEEPTTEAPTTEAPQPKEIVVKGTIEKGSTEKKLILKKASDGKTMTFDISNAKISITATGELIGLTVEVTYNGFGDEKDNVKATYLTDCIH